MSELTIHKNKDGGECAFNMSDTKDFCKPQKSDEKFMLSGALKGGQTIFFQNPARISGRMAIVGEKEGNGPVGKHFKKIEKDPKLGEKNFEHAEIKMMENAARGAIADAGFTPSDMDLIIAGDLINQIVISNYVARNLGIPFLGIYGACSTMAEALLLGATMIDAGHFQKIVCATSSHFATAERQYRYPLEYGCQRPPYSQWTVTGAGSSVLTNGGCGPKITMATIGKVIDFGTNDVNNMGAAMAPAAMETLTSFLKDTQTQVTDYDLIITGDLGKLGSDIFRDLMREKGNELGQNYIDCGNLIYAYNQLIYQGGSGAACSATVLNSYILDKMAEGQYNKVLYLATGALMNTISCYQGDTIPCVCHGIVIEN